MFQTVPNVSIHKNNNEALQFSFAKYYYTTICVSTEDEDKWSAFPIILNGSKQAIMPLLWVSVKLLKRLARWTKLVLGVSLKLQLLQQMQSVSPVSHRGEFKKLQMLLFLQLSHRSTISTLKKQTGRSDLNHLFVSKK